MKRIWKIAGVATLVAVVGVMVVGVVALAQDDDGQANWPFNFAERMREAIANALGITVDKYDEAVTTAENQVLDQAVQEGWLTQDQADKMRERAEAMPGLGLMPRGFGGRGGGFGMRGMPDMRGGFLGGLLDPALSIAADELGMTSQELMTELQDGKSVADVASEKGVDLQVIVDAYVAQITERVNAAVENGNLTQERADWMISQAKERIPALLEQTWEGCWGHGGFRDGERPGRFESFPGASDA